MYERFEGLISRLIMVVLGFVTLYAFGAAVIELVNDLKLGTDFVEKELLQDTFGSILTVLILLEFTHSVYTSLRNRSVIIEATVIVLIAIVVVARKLNSVDFKSATLEQVASYEASLWRLTSCTGCLVPQLVTKSASGSRRRPN